MSELEVTGETDENVVVVLDVVALDEDDPSLETEDAVAEELSAGVEEVGAFELDVGGVVEGGGLDVDGGGVELVEESGVGEGDVLGSEVVVGLELVVLPESLDEAAELESESVDESVCLFLRGILKGRALPSSG